MEVEERRKKIAELKARREAVQKSIEEKNEDGQETKKNYIPKEEALKDSMVSLPLAKSIDHKEELNELKNEQKDGNLMNFVSKKPDWDLKRGLEDKLNILQKRTKKVLLQLLKEELAKQAYENEEEEEEEAEENE